MVDVPAEDDPDAAEALYQAISPGSGDVRYSQTAAGGKAWGRDGIAWIRWVGRLCQELPSTLSPGVIYLRAGVDFALSPRVIYVHWFLSHYQRGL